jgi:hypothetical protein
MAAFLAARHRRHEGPALAQQQGACALGAVELVGRERDGVGRVIRKSKRQLADPLRRVHVHRRARRVGQGCDLGHGHERAGFVVGGHQRDQGQVRAHQGFGGSEVDAAVGQHRHEVHRHALFGQ